MKVRIIKCSLKNSWYNNKVGKSFEVLKSEGVCLEVKFGKTNPNIHFYVLECDCAVVNERRNKHAHFNNFNYERWKNEDYTNAFGDRLLGDPVREFEDTDAIDWHTYG